MARKLRIEFPGAIYHIMSRGDRRESIFRDDLDRKRFMETLDETCAKTGWQIHAYCLMPNHFHLVAETPQPNLVLGMKWFLGTYTVRFNRRHHLAGHLFSGRYKSQIISGKGGYLRSVCDYVHLNPVRAKMLAANSPLRSFHWSSLPAYLGTSERPPWIRLDRGFGEARIPLDSSAGRKEFERRLELRRTEESDDLKLVRHDWCLGDDEFKAELLAQMSGKIGSWHYGEEVHEAAEVKADRIVSEELKRLNWSEESLMAHRKGDSDKIAIARRLRAETTMTVGWIAERLRMGAKSHLTHLLYWRKRLESRGETGEVKRKKPASKPNTNTTIPLTDPHPFDPTFD